MAELAEQQVCQFYRLIPDAPTPQRADRSADGTLPVNAYRYCEAAASASGFGWYLYPPINFALMLEDDIIRWTYEGADASYPLQEGAQFPGFAEVFKTIAPDNLGELSPPFLSPGSLPGTVQIWSGYFARTAPGWALLSRGVANYQNTQPYRNFEGIVETENWLGPLFTNVRLTQTNVAIQFHTRRPLFQVQPVLRECYREPPFKVLEAADLDAEDWRRFAATIKPNTDSNRRLGHYAIDTRKRLHSSSSD
jgi:hypothetical protein